MIVHTKQGPTIANIHTYTHTYIHGYYRCHSVSGLRCLLIFPSFSKKKNRKRERNLATAKSKETEISYFSAKARVHTSRMRILRVECNANTPDPVDQTNYIA